MRALVIGIVALAAAAAPAFASAFSAQHHVMVSYATTEIGGAPIPTISRGTQFAISCDGIKSEGADVRVVLSLDAASGDVPTGYSSVLATKQTVELHEVHVQVPDVPDFANHTVNVKVYVTDAKGSTRACDAGRVRIV
jgi:hypothetical protein